MLKKGKSLTCLKHTLRCLNVESRKKQKHNLVRNIMKRKKVFKVKEDIIRMNNNILKILIKICVTRLIIKGKRSGYS